MSDIMRRFLEKGTMVRYLGGALDKKQSAFFSHTDPNMVEWFGKMVEERKKLHRS